MSTREKCEQILDMLPEYQLNLVLAYMQGLTALSEAEDDRFCAQLYSQYLNDPDRGEF